MMLTVEYLTGLLGQIESLTKELKDSESDNASLHRQLDHWQEISVHWKNARDVLVDERDELAEQVSLLKTTNEVLVDALDGSLR